jgi:rubrerythrin
LELSNITVTIVPLEEYKGALEKIWVYCTECGRKWKAEPHSLLQGKGCSVCSSIRGGMKLRKSHSQFVGELYEKYPHLIVNSQYTTMYDNINFTCSVCHNTFDRIAADIFYNGGCPFCNVNSLPQRQPKSLKCFLQDLHRVNGDIVYLDGYVKASEKLHVKCEICGHDWWAIGTSLTSGVGCPVCNMSHGEKRIREYLHNYQY